MDIWCQGPRSLWLLHCPPKRPHVFKKEGMDAPLEESILFKRIDNICTSTRMNGRFCRN